jgi:hypothetical protein
MQDFPRINIAFSAGAYGHYLKWILYSLLIDEPLVSPFKGSTSHGKDYLSDYAKNAKLFESGMCFGAEELANNLYQVTVGHPWSPTNNPGFIDGIYRISTLVDCVLIPYIDHNTYLLGVHNYLYKTQDNMNDALAYVDKEDLQKGWGIDASQDLSDLPRWILREHHSLNLFNSWESPCSWFAPNHLNKSNCKFVFISNLFYNFLPTIEQIRQFLDVKWIRDPRDLLDFHRTNVKQQKYKYQDIFALQILNSIADGTNFKWNASDITLQTEAYIQRALQHQGIMLQCNGLNVFPTSTNELIEVFE